MRKKLLCVLLAVTVAFSVCGCEQYTTEDGVSYFTKITKDESGTLKCIDTDTIYYSYYYSKDTGVIYVGYLADSTISFQDPYLTPIISEHGNYFRYDKETESAVEITDEEEELIIE